MGQKVNPVGIRLGITQDWASTWYADSKNYADYLNTDLEVRRFLLKKFPAAAISRVQINRPARNARIVIYAARPGVILGKKGGDVEALRKEVAQIMGVPVHINIEEVRKPDLDAKLVAKGIAEQLEKRVMYRRAMKRAVQNAIRGGALGVKIAVSGRLSGAEIARSEWYREGRVPLHTFRADIDYGLAEAQTTYGIIGIKVWIYKGDKLFEKMGAEKNAESKDTAKERNGAFKKS